MQPTGISLLLGVLFYIPSSLAVIETYTFSDAELESRYHALSQELRCPKCQNQNIADSNAEISKDLRALLHRELESGASDDEILQTMVDRYGEFVRYRPRLDQNTLVLWFLPIVMVVIAGALLLFRMVRPLGDAPAALTRQERELLAKSLAESEE